jgi:LemA protein
MSTFIIYVLFLAIVSAVVVIWIYNLLQTKGHVVREAHSNMMVCMKKRVDLANKLVDIAQSYGEHEKLTHLTVSQNDLAVGQVMAIMKYFPELKANQTYQQLMAQYDAIEVDLQKKREGYNAAVRDYNITITKFPMILIAPSIGFKPAQYFDVDDADSLQNLKDFKTDDGTLLKEKFSLVGSKVMDASKAIGNQAMQTGKSLVEKGKEVASPSKETEMPNIVHEEQSENVFCKNCGSGVSTNDKFCAGCGTKVG